MKRKKFVLTVAILLTTFGLFGFLTSYNSKPVLADVKCPPHINPDSLECLDYLRQQLGIVQGQQSNIQKKLKDEEYQQLSLQEKIAYINTEVKQTEQKLTELQIEIAATDIQISLLEKSIQEKEDSISLLKQEMNRLSNAVSQRITEAYKYSFLNQFEILLDITNISSVLRKSKYLTMTRSQDKAVLEKYSYSLTQLKKEESELSESNEKLKDMKETREAEKTELGETKLSLDQQKKTREALLAESRVKEAQLMAAYQQNLKKASDLDKAIINYINTHESEIVDGGWVTTATPIGRMGNTGCSSGSHLHFGLNSGKKYAGWGYFYSDVNLFSTGYLKKAGNSFLYWAGQNWYSPIVVAGSLRNPLSGNYVIMTQDEHQGQAIDLVSYSQNAWGFKNEGAPIYPVMAGQLYKGTESVCGGKYAMVKHTNGMVSVYLHIQ